MKLVETDADRPEDEVEPQPISTPPVPEKRRAYASLSFTAIVLVGIVVTIYTVFPPRRDEATRRAVAMHREPGAGWQLSSPTRDELEAYTTGVLGAPAPLPPDQDDLTATGVRRVSVRHHDAAFIRFHVAEGDVSYLVQWSKDAPEQRVSRRDGDLQIESWRVGPWTCIAVGPAASAERWRPKLGVP